MIALLVTLSTLAIHTTSLVTAAIGDDTRALAEARAAEAAAAGLEWGRHRVAVPAVAVCTPVQTVATLPGTLQPFLVTVRCTAGPLVVDGGAPLRRYQISAVACNVPLAGACPNTATGAGDYVQRTLQLVVHR
ncbi:MAG: agglutinin biogenesis protein MshP [Rubrivivax sp.]|nr:agglutinin biogenesis protein MshP [Rubrivivax sp.]